MGPFSVADTSGNCPRCAGRDGPRLAGGHGIGLGRSDAAEARFALRTHAPRALSHPRHGPRQQAGSRAKRRALVRGPRHDHARVGGILIHPAGPGVGDPGHRRVLGARCAEEITRSYRYQDSCWEWLEWLRSRRGLGRPERVSLEEVSIAVLRIRGMLPASQCRQEREAAPLFGAHGMTVEW